MNDKWLIPSRTPELGGGAVQTRNVIKVENNRSQNKLRHKEPLKWMNISLAGLRR
jgi:hypothetical protein